MRTFALVWAGQLVSTVGSGLSAFAIGIWVYQQTRSATLFATIALAASLPALLSGPLAGAVADRFDRRKLMIAADSGAALGSLTLLLLVSSGSLELWHLYPVIAFGSLCAAFQWPAYDASITLLIPKRHFSRVGGLLSLGPAISNISAPLMAGFLLQPIGLQGILCIDLATYFFALATLLGIRLPAPPPSDRPDGGEGLMRQALQGWRFIRQHTGLQGLLIYFAGINIALRWVTILLVPMVLSYSTSSAAGSVVSAGGLGMLAGSLFMSVAKGAQRKIFSVLGSGALFGVSLACVGLRPSIPLTAAAFSVVLFLFPVMKANSQAIWRAKVPPALQGRVTALRTTVLGSVEPPAYLAAGPLADYFFRPLMQEGGPLAEPIGRILGVGPGRGIGLMFVLVGLAVSLASVLACLAPRLRSIDIELPDAVGADDCGSAAGKP